jgi:3-dehydroquinate dehydratase
MKTFRIVINEIIDYHTTVRANSLEEAQDIAAEMSLYGDEFIKFYINPSTYQANVTLVEEVKP